MVKSGIPVPVFYTIFGLGIILSIGLIVIVSKSDKYTGITKNIVIWFGILMVLNLSNLLFTFVYYEKKKVIKGKKGEKGEVGVRGFPGENVKCGNNLCGSFGQNECPDDEKDAAGQCIITGGTKDESGQDREQEDNIKVDRCKFPFVYNYKNQYEPIKQYTGKDTDGNDILHPDYPREGEDRMGLPIGGEIEGVCATELNENGTAKTWGFFTGNSARAKEMSNTNRRGNANEQILESQMGILDIKITSGDTDREASCPKGYDRIEGDLNQGAGSYVYLCAKNGVSTVGVTDIAIVEGDDRCSKVFTNAKKDEVTRLTTNLNKDTDVGKANPQELYMCIKKQTFTPESRFLTDIQVKEQNDYNTPDKVYRRVNIGNSSNGDLNKDTTGAPVFLYTTSRSREIEPLKSAFYVPNSRTLYFMMGTGGIHTYVYKDETRSEGITTPLLEQNMTVNILGKDIPVNYEVICYLTDRLFVFKGKLVYEIDFQSKTKKPGYPKNLDSLFPEIPPNLDAAYVHPTNKDYYFFKDKLVYRFRPVPSNDSVSLGKLLTGYPKTISQEFKGAPDYPDAVFTVPDEKEHNYTFIARATTFKIFDEDNILVQDVDTISIDIRFGLQTNKGFKKPVVEGFADKLKDQEYEKPEPEPYKCPPNARKFDLENEECKTTPGNMEQETGTGPSNKLKESPFA
jgi:hypothetical protein